jgi:hypothetical protein
MPERDEDFRISKASKKCDDETESSPATEVAGAASLGQAQSCSRGVHRYACNKIIPGPSQPHLIHTSRDPLPQASYSNAKKFH